MKIHELMNSLKQLRGSAFPLFGLVEGEVTLPICSFGVNKNDFEFTILYAEKKIKRTSEALRLFVNEETLGPDFELFLRIEKYTQNYCTLVFRYRVSRVFHEQGRFYVSAELDEMDFSREYPPDPYLLQKQKEEPLNNFYFPFRPGFDCE